MTFNKDEEKEVNKRIQDLIQKGCRIVSDTGYNSNDIRKISITDYKGRI
jgi:hypothetical protein